MAIPTRPADGGGIATDWGQQVHDDTFSPPGCRLAGGSVSVGDSWEQLPLSTATEDPGGWLDAVHSLAEVPTDRAGLYLISVDVQSDNSTYTTKVRIRLNGSGIITDSEDGEGTTAIRLGPTTLRTLAVGDQVTVWARRAGSGSGSPDVYIRRLSIVRLGRELGA